MEMMNVYHISPIYNRNSILKRGILPRPVRSWHKESFEKRGDCTKDGRAVYTIYDCEKIEKYLMDHTYCVIHISPRNNLEEKWEADRYTLEDVNKIIYNYRSLENKLLFKYDQMIFDVYEAEVKGCYIKHYHAQTPNDKYYNTTYHMDDKFAHENKPMQVFPHALKKLKIVMQTQFYWSSNRANIKVLKNVIY